MPPSTLPPLLIRADAGAGIGLGHVMRCLALGEAWHERGGAVRFRGMLPAGGARRRLESFSDDVVGVRAPHPDPTDLSGTLDALRDLAERTERVPWLLLDGYHFDPEFVRDVQRGGFRVAMLDDTASLPSYPAELVINQNLYAERLEYRSPPETVLLCGIPYALLRSEFRARAGAPSRAEAVARRVLVTMGGADPDNVTAWVLEALSQLSWPALEVRAVIGVGNPHLAALEERVRQLELDVTLLRDVPDMPALMEWAHVAISAGGSTCWELALLGVPTIVIELAANQEVIAQGMMEAGAAVRLGAADRLNLAELAGAAHGLLSSPERRKELRQAARGFVDGRGVDRVIDVVQLLDGGGSTAAMQVRPARLEDSRTLWRLANDPVLRSNSFDRPEIGWEDHSAWFWRQLSATDSRLWVLDVGGTAAAQVRYDRRAPDLAEVHFSVVAGFRGRGLGTLVLSRSWDTACEELRVDRVRGVVLASNTPSIRAFRAAGYTAVEQTLERGHPCLVFERERTR